ncbi:hypothetical protein AURDEDRAFT_160846 [Auricularia subglabra TFB-10046 SS5]|nr:hypothetical protein AURDEDRAFT_160846 [Auricularia subglabra TFB-10046 SS5]
MSFINTTLLFDPSSHMHQTAMDNIRRLWPFIVRLVPRYPDLANSMRAALPPPLPPSAPALLVATPAVEPVPPKPPKPPLSRVDKVLREMKKQKLSLGAFLQLLFEKTPDGCSRSPTHATTVSAFLRGDTRVHADKIVRMIHEHSNSIPRATRGDSRRAQEPKDASRMARAKIEAWAVQLVRKLLKTEMSVLVDPRTSKLRPQKGFSWKILNASSIELYGEAISTAAPTLHRIMLSLATTPAKEQEIEGSAAYEGPAARGKAKRDPRLVATCATLMLAASRAPRANLFQRFIGAWLWSICAPAAVYNILCRAGLSVSYATVLKFLQQLAQNGLLELHTLLSLALWIVIYDNINRRHQVWRPKLGQTSEQLNGTAPTIVATDETDRTILDPEPVHAARRAKKRLALTTDSIRDSIDMPHQRRVMAYHCLLFLVSWVGGPLELHQRRILDAFRTTLAKRRVPAGRKTAVYPLGTSAFNEATTRGTKDVLDDIFLNQLGQDPDELVKQLQVVGGDQLTVARLRSLQGYSESCPHGYPALRWVLTLVLVWHMGWADLARVIHTHYGKGAAGDPSALHHVNVILKRRVKDEDRPDFYPALRLVSELLKADTLDCWMIVLKTNDLRAHFAAATVTFEQLEAFAFTIVDRYFNLAAAESVERGSGMALSEFTNGDPWNRPPSTTTTANIPVTFAGDQTLANGIRRRRDSMLQYEFQYAIADGDFGRAWQVMLGWTSTFAGSGHTKYLDEMLELFCNFAYEYPQRLTDFIWDHSVASLSGREHSYVPLDLIQEWMIGEIKSHMARSDETFDSKFVRGIVAPNIRGAQECKQAMRRMFGLAKSAAHRTDRLDDDCVARLLRDIQTTQSNRFRKGRHYGHAANDDDATGYNALEGGKMES